ncbi:hypothetical protein E2C01_011576 [Portunus trituberculatus]|uniref:Uncharacterized protein n=1 Tax=Portunus trituberculatus TaxID=210409 RepID=A0A5B7DBP4_PORTR|nr:hypothetical protein [Portunus trituberculatus]
MKGEDIVLERCQLRLTHSQLKASLIVEEEGNGVIRVLAGDQHWPELFNEVQQCGAPQIGPMQKKCSEV